MVRARKPNNDIIYRTILLFLLHILPTSTVVRLLCYICKMQQGALQEPVNNAKFVSHIQHVINIFTQYGTDLDSQMSCCKSVCRSTLLWEPTHSFLVHIRCVAEPIYNKIFRRQQRPRRSTVACYPDPRSKTASVTGRSGWSHFRSSRYLQHIPSYLEDLPYLFFIYLFDSHSM
jgi:hypothetical protein